MQKGSGYDRANFHAFSVGRWRVDLYKWKGTKGSAQEKRAKDSEEIGKRGVNGVELKWKRVRMKESKWVLSISKTAYPCSGHNNSNKISHSSYEISNKSWSVNIRLLKIEIGETVLVDMDFSLWLVLYNTYWEYHWIFGYIPDRMGHRSSSFCTWVVHKGVREELGQACPTNGPANTFMRPANYFSIKAN